MVKLRDGTTLATNFDSQLLSPSPRIGKYPVLKYTQLSTFSTLSRASNLVVTNPSGRIVALAQQIGVGKSRVRQLQVGGTYSAPPAPAKRGADKLTSASELKHVVLEASTTARDKRGLLKLH